MKLSLTCVLLLLICFLCLSCSSKEALSPIQPKGLIEFRYDEGDISKLSPFEYHWVAPRFIENKGLVASSYDSYYINMLPTQYLDKDSWESSKGSRIDSKEDYEKRVKMLAEYFKNELIEMHKQKAKRFNVVQAPGARTMRVDIAFTEVQFGNPSAYAGAFAVPLPGTTHALDSMANPMMAFELKVVDSKTGEIIAEIADKKTPRSKPLDLNKFTTNSPMREIIDRWVEEAARSGSMEKGKKVAGTVPVGILPW